MSLRWRILGAFILVIIFTVLLSTGVAYWATQRRLDRLATDINIAETNELARILSRVYTEEEGWDMLEMTLFRTGYLFNEALLRELIPEAERDRYEANERRNRIRVVVVDNEGTILVDSFSELAQGTVAPQIDGEPARIFDLDSRQAVGAVYVDVNRDFLAPESEQFLIDILRTTAIGGLLTAVIALLLAAWLSRRITAPVITLTQAAQSIIQRGDTQLLPVISSDELGQMSATFNQMTTALQTQRDLRTRLIDDVSHELNTPLSVILLEAKGLRDGIQTPTEAANHIIHEVDMLRNLVHDLNWLAETDSGELRLKVDSCSIGQLLTTEVERWQLQAQVADVELVLLPLPPDLPTIHMDTVRMNQAVGNLIQNGLQHTPAGGRVTVQCGVEDGWVETVVCDTGSGIAAEDLPFVFERFYRADPSRQRDKGGRGLGLSIVKQTVEAHQGQVWAESELGKGSCFYFRLPV